jgi:hypothetical protein
MGKYIYVTEPIPPERAEKWRRKRWREDGVADLPPGFTFKANGRQGSIYLREGEKTLEIPWEMSGVPQYDILVHLSGLSRWILPQAEPISGEDQARIEEALKAWLTSVKYRAELLRP